MAMATAQLGNTFTTAELKKRIRRFDSSGLSITETWLCASGSATWLIGDQHPTSTTLYLSEFETEECPPKDIVTLVYRKKTWSGGMGRVVAIKDTITLSADANAMEIPIEQHKDPVTGLSDYSETWETLKAGVTSFISPQPVYTHEKIYDTFTWSQDDIISTVGQIATPPGMTSPTVNRWLHVGRSISEQGDSVVVRDTYQYANNGWDTDIYAGGTP